MRQRDCGCGQQDLRAALEAAKYANLPVARDRLPPPARFGATLSGHLRWGLIDRRGREIRGGEQSNLILDQGLDQIADTIIISAQGSVAAPASYFPIITYAAVGTDSAAPVAAQTGLGAELARGSTQYDTEEITRPANGVYRITRYIEFGYAEANGNLTEWGFSYASAAGSNLFNRALFLDGVGSPDVVTKTSEYKLRLCFTLEITLSPVAFTAGSFSITGVGTVTGNYMLLGGTAPPGVVVAVDMRCTAPDVKGFSALARGSLETSVGTSVYARPGSLAAHANDQSGTAYATDVAIFGSAGLGIARDVTDARDAYVPGSFQRTGGSWFFDTAYANYDPIRSFFIGGSQESWSGGTLHCARAAYVFDLALASEFTKDDEHALRIGCPLTTWGRA
jgi:hypothetical protein